MPDLPAKAEPLISLLENQTSNHFHISSTKTSSGANTPWASNEETDLLIRLLTRNKDNWLKELSIAHHSLQISPSRSLKYGMGRFEVISTHRLGIGIYLINLFQPIARYLKNPKPYNLLLCISTMLGRSGILNQAFKTFNPRTKY